jgi:hypothetical protein
MSVGAKLWYLECHKTDLIVPLLALPTSSAIGLFANVVGLKARVMVVQRQIVTKIGNSGILQHA